MLHLVLAAVRVYTVWAVNPGNMRSVEAQGSNGGWVQVGEYSAQVRAARAEVESMVAAAHAKDRENSKLWEQVGLPTAAWIPTAARKNLLKSPQKGRKWQCYLTLRRTNGQSGQGKNQVQGENTRWREQLPLLQIARDE